MLVSGVGHNPFGVAPVAVAPATVNFGVNKEATIPCFDLAGMEFMPAGERTKLVNDFGDAMSRIGPGFVAVYVPELCGLVQDALQQQKDYFAQERDDKMKDWHNNYGQTGYSYHGFERAAGAKLPDNKETFFISEEFNRWPEGRPDFERVMKEIHSKGRYYSQLITSLLMEYLRQPNEVYQGFTTGNLLRLAHYLSSSEAEPGAEWAGEHTDLNKLTLLFPASRSGLQMRDREGNWVSVVVPPGYMIVNAGDQFETISAGKILATPHRVINDDPSGDPERHSIIYFDSWEDEKSLKPFENCLEEAAKEERDTSMYVDCTVAEHKASRLIEIGLNPNPTREEVIELRKKGLLQKPTPALQEQFPEVFSR